MKRSRSTTPISLCVVCAVLAATGCAAKSQKAPQKTQTYLESRQSYSTILKTRGPAPQEWRKEITPKGVSEITYRSGDLDLKAWLVMPEKAQTGNVPAVVYFHGGFAFSFSELDVCLPFLDAGFAVMTPTLRGENGNSGNFELFYGEVDDAAAAVNWLAKQPRIDPKRIYTFGHSVGGGISALLSLRADVPIRKGGSSGGLYSQNVFSSWRKIVPFDPSIDKERDLRLLVGNIAYMQREHIAYLGRQDNLAEAARQAEAEARVSGAPLTVRLLEGDHFSSLDRAIDAFVKAVRFE